MVGRQLGVGTARDPERDPEVWPGLIHQTAGNWQTRGQEVSQPRSSQNLPHFATASVITSLPISVLAATEAIR